MNEGVYICRESWLVAVCILSIETESRSCLMHRRPLQEFEDFHHHHRHHCHHNQPLGQTPRERSRRSMGRRAAVSWCQQWSTDTGRLVWLTPLWWLECLLWKPETWSITTVTSRSDTLLAETSQDESISKRWLRKERGRKRRRTKLTFCSRITFFPLSPLTLASRPTVEARIDRGYWYPVRSTLSVREELWIRNLLVTRACHWIMLETLKEWE